MLKSPDHNFDDTRSLITGLENDQSKAQNAVFDEYHQKLIAMVRSNVNGRLSRRLDASDVVQSALRTFFLHAREQKFQIEQRSELWSLLVTITLNKLRNQARFHNADKRSPDREEQNGHIPTSLLGRTPDPRDAALINDEVESIVSQLRPFHQEIAERILAGQPSAEIATATNRSLRTVRRVENILKENLEKHLGSSDE